MCHIFAAGFKAQMLRHSPDIGTFQGYLCCPALPFYTRLLRHSVVSPQ